MKINKLLSILTLLLAITSGTLFAQTESGIYWVDYEGQLLNHTDADGANYDIKYMGAQNARQSYLDTTNKRIFWNTTDHIRLASLDYSSFEIVTTGTGLLGGIFYDADTDYLWWTEKAAKKIIRLDLSTGDKMDILDESDGLESPTGIIFHGGFLYWADDESNTINRSAADGEDLTVLIADAGTAKDLDIDPENEWIYWANTDNISRAGIDGENIESILTGSVLQFSLDIITQKIYYANTTGMGGDLKVYDIEEQTTETLSEIFRDFSNPRGLNINPGDGIYHVGEKEILKYDFKADSNIVAITNFQPDHIVADFDEEMVFWTDRTTKAIYKADSDFSAIEIFSEDMNDFNAFGGLAIDADNNFIFYSLDNVVYRNTYDGLNPDSLYNAFIRAGSMVADPVNEELYFLDTSNHPASLMKVNYDGSGEEILIDKAVSDPKSLVLDLQNEFIYFSRFIFGRGVIERTNLDGSGRISLFDSNDGEPIAGLLALSLDINNGDLYYGSADILYKTAVDSSGFSEVYSDTPTQVFGITVNIPTKAGTGIEKSNVPKTTTLHQNYPNPFNPATVISYQLTVMSEVRLDIFDLVGRKVATLLNGERKSAGNHSITFDASSLSSGIYIYRLQSGNSILTQKMTLIK